MKIVILSAALLASVSASAAWRNVVVGYYRNWFGETLPHLEAMERDRVRPDVVKRLAEPATSNLFGVASSVAVGRLVAGIMRGEYVPARDGYVKLTLPENRSCYRLFIDGAEVDLGAYSAPRRLERLPPRTAYGRPEEKSVRAITTKTPIACRAGVPVRFKIHFLTGFYGDGVSLQAVPTDRYGRPLPPADAAERTAEKK